MGKFKGEAFVQMPDDPGLDLAECDGCHTYVEQMRQTIRAIGHVPHEPITARTRDEVLAIFRAWKAERG